ncbi:MAG: hypothetical protein LBE18_12425 [Planctomycetaceae bacterium]|jgi:hypothetical protein|nr:hypothetical protein [Planctomycetaceae bacterium]
MNCNTNSNVNRNVNRVGSANIAIDRNCKINFAKASIEMCQKIFCNLQSGAFMLFTGKNLLTIIFSFWIQQIFNCISRTQKLVQHYYMLYRLRKRGGICCKFWGRIFQIISKKADLRIRDFQKFKSILSILSIGLLGTILFSGNLVAYERLWFDDFEEAKSVAQASNKNLLIYFSATGSNYTPIVEAGSRQVRNRGQLGSLSQICNEFERNVFETEEVINMMNQFVVLKIPVDKKIINDNGGEVLLIETPMFKEMVGHPGLAIIDFEDYDKPFYGELIGVLPFINFAAPTQFHIATFLTIPSCKLTQRTLTYAVKIHPDRPQSADGNIDPTLLIEATGHAEYQAKNRILGHQNFSARSSRVRAVLGEGISEVCAQSGLYSGHFEAAIACVRGWRGSPAHWRCVRAKQKYYAYDMVKSSNGVWYATGLFVGP